MKIWPRVKLVLKVLGYAILFGTLPLWVIPAIFIVAIAEGICEFCKWFRDEWRTVNGGNRG